VGAFNITRDANAFRVVDGQGIMRVLLQTRSEASRYMLGLVQDRFGNRIQIEADDGGLPLTIVDSGVRVIRTTRDANRRITGFQVQQPDGSWLGCQRSNTARPATSSAWSTTSAMVPCSATTTHIA